MDLGKSSFLSWVLSVELGILGFEEEIPESDSLKLVFGGRDLSLTIIGVELADFSDRLGGLGGWVGLQVPVDTPR